MMDEPDRSSLGRSALRIAYLSTGFGPNGIGGTTVRGLRERGHDVQVFTGPRIGSTAGTAARGVKWWRQSRERLSDGTAIHRYPLFPSHDSSVIHRLGTYGSFAASSALLAQRRLSEADVVLVGGSPSTHVFAALVNRFVSGVPFVFWIHDVLPDSIFAADFIRPGSAITKLTSMFEVGMSESYRQAAEIVAISPGMRELLISRGADPEHTHAIYLSAPGGVFDQTIEPVPRNPGDPLRLMYAGNLGRAQGLDNVIRAVAKLPPGRFSLVFVGSGTAENELKNLVAELRLSNVEFCSRVSVQEMPEILAGAQVHLVSLADRELFKVTVPSKLQSLMAAGLPICCVSPGEASQLVEESGAGVGVEAADPQALAIALGRLETLNHADFARMGSNGRRFYDQHMSPEVTISALSRVVERAALARRGR